MKKTLFILLALMAGLHSQAQQYTFSKDIAPVIYANCSYCHHAGAIGPFSLTNYNDVYSQRYAIVGDISIHKMPPWPPDVKYSRLSHERIISQSQIDMIKSWVDSGAVRGDSSLEPPVPTYTNASTLKSVDLSKTIPTYTVEANTDIYRCFAIPSGFTKDQVITGLECLPANRKIVHHILLYWDTTGACAALDKADPKPGYLSFGGVGSNSAVLIGGWVPGGSSMELPSGMGMTIPKGADLVIQIHYAPGNIGAEDSTSFNLEFATTSGLREVYQQPALNHFTSMLNGPLDIPANTKKSFKEEVTLPFDVSVIGIAPHMHLIGQNIKVYAVPLFSTDTIPLIRINQWDFHWQGFYQYRKVLTLKAGTSVYAEAMYDNTTDNPSNPNSPPKEVVAGENTTDEMMIVFFSFLLYQKGDENIVLDTSALVNGIEKQTPLALQGLNIYPNPASQPDIIKINFDQPEAASTFLEVINADGKIVYSKIYSLPGGANTIEIPGNNIPHGFYLFKVFSKGQMRTQKMIVN